MKRVVLMLSAAAAVFLAGVTAQALPRILPSPVCEVKELIGSLDVGTPVRGNEVTVVPLYNRSPAGAFEFCTLDEALSKGWIDIREKGDSGSVPELVVNNLSGKYVFLMGGEIVSGGKQDRILRRDVLLKPHGRGVVLPVYCVEQGRWTKASDNFHSKGYIGSSSLRSLAQETKKDNQCALWKEVREVQQKASVRSKTYAYGDFIREEKIAEKVSRLEKELEGLPGLSPDTVGAAIIVQGRIVSIDVFSSPEMFRKMWSKILRSAAFSDPQSGCRADPNPEQLVLRVLRHIYAQDFDRSAGADLGFDLSSLDGEWVASALSYREKAVHLSVFPSEETPVQMYYHSERTPVIR